jgi:hypothetical protein
MPHSARWLMLYSLTQPPPTPPASLAGWSPFKAAGLDNATLASLYNRALTCWHVRGPAHAETQAAITAAFSRNANKW